MQPCQRCTRKQQLRQTEVVDLQATLANSADTVRYDSCSSMNKPFYFAVEFFINSELG
jgi:hypothetical protein